ncbi:MAG: MFS transporter [Planctomycetes bacterium]|nr:MFS transporter [Planctomycetota bacterium]
MGGRMTKNLDASIRPIGKGAYLALAAALLGWMFDGAEMGVFSIVSRPAVKNLLGPDKEADIVQWIGVITGLFLVGAATGGVLFGWLGDRIGRVRAMTISVLTYAVFTSLCGIVKTPIQLGALRFIASLGMGGEWSLGVALVMEIWPNRSRAFMAGLIGAAANVGYLMVGFVGLTLNSLLSQIEAALLAIQLPDWMVSALVGNSGWRIMMILGIFPALLTFFIRLFVPESKRWQAEREKGHTSNWATADLLAVLGGAMGPLLMVYLYGWNETLGWEHTTPVRLTAIVVGVLLSILGYTYPVMRYLQRYRSTAAVVAPDMFGRTMRRMALAACLSGIALLGTWGATQQAPAWVAKMTEGTEIKNAKENVLIWLSVGAIIGTLAAAKLGDALGRKTTYFLLCVASLASVFWLFFGHDSYSNRLLASACVAGICTASFYGWLPLYLPELFSTNVRATGQGFGFNFGRILAAVGSFQLGPLTNHFSQGMEIGPIRTPAGLPTACGLLSLIYLLGMILIWFAPETKGKPLPD